MAFAKRAMITLAKNLAGIPLMEVSMRFLVNRVEDETAILGI